VIIYVNETRYTAACDVFWYTDDMKLYRFSPIKNQQQLEKAIQYTHEACYKLCHLALDAYLPVAGNVGIFCHYDDEYAKLIALRKELTDSAIHFNHKYFKLYEPINIPAHGNIPAATYEYLYIRQPDPYRAQVGDVDFVMRPDKYKELKKLLRSGTAINAARLYEGSSGLDMVELYDPDIDALGYLTTSTMADKRAD
jgi:hypothetical protein